MTTPAEPRDDAAAGTDDETGERAVRWHCLAEECACGVRSLTTGEAATRHHVVIVPGLGALGYLVPLVAELGGRGIRATLLDLPGFGRHGDGLGSAPTIADVAAGVVRWCAGLPDGENLVLLGHSTGSQAALQAAVRMQDDGRPPAALVMAGPTVALNQRSLPRLLATAPLAYRRDSPAELRVLGDYRRAGRDILTMLRTAIADRPERTVRELTVPLVVTAGRHDAFAPPGWLVALAHAAASRTARVVRLPGSHNNPYTHPGALATVVESLATEAARPRRARRVRTGTRARGQLTRSA